MTKWNEPTPPKGQKYPNYKKIRTASGHTITYDDSKGEENISIQHRSGSMTRMDPNGTVVHRNAKDKYEVTMGDSKVMISGVSDVTVNGGASLRVEGDYDMTINGNLKMAVKGNYEQVVNGNKNALIKGKSDTAIHGAETVKVKGNYEHTSEGKTYIGSATGLKVESTGAMVRVIAASKLSLKGKTSAALEAATNIGIKGQNVVVQAPTFGHKGSPAKHSSATEWEVSDPGNAETADE